MPTARELLEQADALMRRNRALPPSTSRPATPSPAEPRPPTAASAPVASPRPIQREPIVPSVVHTSLPIEDADAVEFAEPLTARERQPEVDVEPDVPASSVEAADDADFPVLTDAVDEPAAGPSVPADDDLPLLTDAVTRIGSVGVDEAARGEPSLWELTSRGEASVLGPAPDSVIVVPPAETPIVPRAPPQGRDPLGFDQPAPGFLTSHAPADEPLARNDQPALVEPTDEAVGEVFGDAPTHDDVADAAHGVADASTRSYTEEDDEPHVFSATVSHMPPEDAEEAAVGAGDPPASGAEGPVPAETSFTSADVVAYEAPTLDAQAGEFAEQGAGATASADSSAPTEGVTPAAGYDQQRIREIAEEIGMQVLQRIDIFTDTTLRAQLGERLRPVVDRAAADLVTAINEHVGELLRAQVAEAIEREIESWRNR